MTAHHFFVDSLDASRIAIEGDDAKHAVRVLRIGAGERITVSDGRGGIADAEVLDASRTMTARILSRRIRERVPPHIAVYQGLPKSGKIEDIVQSLVQLGVDEVVPVRMRRSIPKWDPHRALDKVERLRTVAREAAMQSRRAHLPLVGDVVDLDGIPEGALVLHEAATTRLGEAVPTGPPLRVNLVAGPEGGIDEAEIAALAARGGVPVSLGPQVLRTELAAVVACAILLGRWGRLA